MVLTGVAALVAGACSMGTGEYVPVTNQNELVHAEVATERIMHARFPAAEQAELADTFTGYAPTRGPRPGWPPRSPGTRTPRCACIPARNSASTRSSRGAHPAAAVPGGLPSLAAALGIAAVALLAGGMMVGRLTGRPLPRSGLRQLALGGVAVAATFAVGSLIGGGHGA